MKEGHQQTVAIIILITSCIFYVYGNIIMSSILFSVLIGVSLAKIEELKQKKKVHNSIQKRNKGGIKWKKRNV